MSQPPQFVVELVERASQAIQLLDGETPIGCHYFLNENEHEISLFVSSIEIVGGAEDGQRIEPRFIVNLISLLDVLDEIEGFSWQPNALNDQDELADYVSLSGTYAGHAIWLRILSRTPECFLPGCLTDAQRQSIVNIWNESDED